MAIIIGSVSVDENNMEKLCELVFQNVMLTIQRKALEAYIEMKTNESLNKLPPEIIVNITRKIVDESVKEVLDENNNPDMDDYCASITSMINQAMKNQIKQQMQILKKKQKKQTKDKQHNTAKSPFHYREQSC